MLHLAPNTSAKGSRVLHPRSVSVLDGYFATRPAEDLVDYALSGALGRIALVSSFGAEAAVLLHMVSRIAPATPVLFLDTALLFPETLAYQQSLATRLGLSDVRVLRADTSTQDPDDTLHRRDPDACCALRKTAPLQEALQEFDGWLTGRKRAGQGPRATLPHAEPEHPSGRIKLNPLAAWTADRTAAYFESHALPRHPLVAQGYASIGCAPCTTPVAPGEDARAGRWRGTEKLECGIHFSNGQAERAAS